MYFVLMVTYSITYSVDQKLEHEWLAWMHLDYIPQIMDAGYFEDFRVVQLIHPEPQLGTRTYNLQFTCESRMKLKTYQMELEETHSQVHHEKYRDQVVSFYTILRDVNW